MNQNTMSRRHQMAGALDALARAAQAAVEVFDDDAFDAATAELGEGEDRAVWPFKVSLDEAVLEIYAFANAVRAAESQEDAVHGDSLDLDLGGR